VEFKSLQELTEPAVFDAKDLVEVEENLMLGEQRTRLKERNIHYDVHNNSHLYD